MKRIGNRRAWAAALLAAGLAILSSACGQAPAATGKTAAKKTAALPAAYLDAAHSALGSDAKVLLSGDLAHNGHIQLLVVDRLPKMPGNQVPGLFVSHATILQKQGDDWMEIFLADQQLKNPKGFLARTPLDSVSAWRLQYDKEPNGLAMYFTPVRQSTEDRPPTIEVRWNPKVGRYQSLDRNFKHFLSEAPTLGPVPEFRMTQ